VLLEELTLRDSLGDLLLLVLLLALRSLPFLGSLRALSFAHLPFLALRPLLALGLGALALSCQDSRTIGRLDGERLRLRD